jgi:hypothetical protein
MIKELLASLPSDDLEQIMKAFNEEEMFILTLDNDHILAVHLPETYEIEIIETAGSFTYGSQ